MAIIGTEAFVLSKIDYSESSIIAKLFTLSEGKITVIVKGGRRKNSREGKLIDPMNKVTITLYTKANREIQTLSSCDLLSFYPPIRNDYTVLMCAFAVLELVNAFLHDNEVNEQVFRGIDRILNRLGMATEPPYSTLSRFFLFILQIAGFELVPDVCNRCGNEPDAQNKCYLDYQDGILCGACKESGAGKTILNAEHFYYLKCLKSGKAVAETVSYNTVTHILTALELYARHQSESFTGLKSLLMK